MAATARLFIGLWPTPAALQTVLAQRVRWAWPKGTRLVAPPKLHLTLYFLGDVATGRIPELIAALDMPAPAFVLTLESAAVWHQGVAVLAPGAPPPELLALHDRLGATLHRLSLPVEARRFRPHLTLARDARGAIPPDEPEPIAWPVTACRLAQSQDGRYTTLAQWPAMP